MMPRDPGDERDQSHRRQQADGAEQHRGRGDGQRSHRENHAATQDTFVTTWPDVGVEADVAESRLELRDLSRDFGRRGEGVAAPTWAERPLNARDRPRFRLPGRVVGIVPLHLERLFLFHPPREGAFDRGPIARHHSLGGERARARQPRPEPRTGLDERAGLFFEQRLLEIAIGNADVFAERQDFVLRESVADVALAGLQLGGALNDTLQRLAADEVLPHQAFAFPLFSAAGKLSPDVRSGKLRFPESAEPIFSMNPRNRSMGMGKIVVELFSEAISLTVWR